MTAPVFDLWVYLSGSPLIWLIVTLGAYSIAVGLHRLSGGNPVVNPVAISVTLIVSLLLLTGTDYRSYFDGAQFVYFLLGPATVALAVPLYQHRDQVRQALVPMLAALFTGSLTAIVSAVGIAWALGGSPEILASLAPKSATSPIAMAIAEQIGGLPALAAALVIVTGVLGAVIASPVLNLFRISDRVARGFALGVAAHGIGTARAFQVDQVSGTFAGIGMGLNGLLTALLIPFLATLV